MRWIALLVPLALGACEATAFTDTDAEEGSLGAVDVVGGWVDPAPRKPVVRAVHLRFDVGPADLRFNNSEVLLAEDVPPGGATPLVPVPLVQLGDDWVTSASMQLLVDGEVVASSATRPLEPGEAVTLAVYGVAGAESALSLPIDLVPEAGSFKLRIVHTLPGLPYAGILSPTAGTLAQLTYGTTTEVLTLPADVEHTLLLDINADGRPDLPYQPVSFSEGEVVDLFLIPSGSSFPAPINLPVPVLLAVPLDAPDGITPILPAI